MAALRNRFALALAVVASGAGVVLGLEARVSVEKMPRCTRAIIEIRSESGRQQPGIVELVVEPNDALTIRDVVLSSCRYGEQSYAEPTLIREGSTIRAIAKAAASPCSSGDTARREIMTIVFDTDTIAAVQELGDIVETLRLVRLTDKEGMPLSSSLLTRFEGIEVTDNQRSLASTAQAAYTTAGRRHTLRFYLPQKVHVRATVTGRHGEAVARLLDKKVGAGVHAVSWQEADEYRAADTTATYFMQLEMGGTVFSTRVVGVSRNTPSTGTQSRHGRTEQEAPHRRQNSSPTLSSASPVR
jgi:hypothetical protein